MKQNKDKTIRLRVTVAELLELKSKAKKENISLSKYIREKLK